MLVLRLIKSPIVSLARRWRSGLCGARGWWKSESAAADQPAGGQIIDFLMKHGSRVGANLAW